MSLIHKFVFIDSSDHNLDDQKEDENTDCLVFGHNRSLANESMNKLQLELVKSIFDEEHPMKWMEIILPLIQRKAETMHHQSFNEDRT